MLEGWVDGRVRAALDHVIGQLGKPDSPVSKAVDVQAARLADRVADRVDESLGRLPQLVDQLGDKVREDVHQAVLQVVPDAATIAQQVADAIKSLIPFRPFGFVGGAAGQPPFGPGGPEVRPPKEREPEGE